jgi:DNA polymerase-3 subunit alpha
MITLAGLLTSLRVKPSKKGGLWASGVLEDLRGSAELLVFPQALQQLQNVLKPDTALVVKGRVRQEENGGPKVVVSEARPLDTGNNGAKPGLVIMIDLEDEDRLPELSAKIEGLLAACPGDSPVVFELTRPGDFRVRLRPRRMAGVRATDELLARLRALCGEQSVILQKPA